MKQHLTTLSGKTFGPHNSRSKLTVEKAEEIRRLRQESGMAYRAIGALFEIDHKTARSVAIGKTWATSQSKAVFRADEEELEPIKTLTAQGIGVKKIASILGVTERSVLFLRQKHGIRSLHSKGE